MINRILPVTIALLTVVLICNAPCFNAAAFDQSPKGVDQLEIDQLITNLSDSKFAVREEATTRLIQVGPPAIPSLLKVCNSPDMETSWRAVRILETIGLEGDLQTLKTVMAGLLSIADDSNESLINRSRKLATRYKEYQTQIAVKKLRAMGATVHEYPVHTGMADLGMGFMVPIEADFGGRIIIAEEPEMEWRDILPEEVEVELIEEIPERADVDDEETVEEEADSCGAFIDDEDADQEAESPEDSGEDSDEEEQVSDEAQQIDDEIDRVILEALKKADEPEEEAAELERVLEDRGIRVFADGLVVAGPATATESENVMTRSITIDQNWKGGAEGLKLIAQINNVRNIQMSGIEIDTDSFESLGLIKQVGQINFHNCVFSGKDMMKFASEHPQLHISAVGIAMMGVYPTQYTSAEKTGCQLERIAPNSAAQKAGMLAGDTIIKVDNVKVVDFPTLTYTVAGRKVGDTLDVVVLRDGEEEEMKLTLGARADIE